MNAAHHLEDQHHLRKFHPVPAPRNISGQSLVTDPSIATARSNMTRDIVNEIRRDIIARHTQVARYTQEQEQNADTSDENSTDIESTVDSTTTSMATTSTSNYTWKTPQEIPLQQPILQARLLGIAGPTSLYQGNRRVINPQAISANHIINIPSPPNMLTPQVNTINSTNTTPTSSPTLSLANIPPSRSNTNIISHRPARQRHRRATALPATSAYRIENNNPDAGTTQNNNNPTNRYSISTDFREPIDSSSHSTAGTTIAPRHGSEKHNRLQIALQGYEPNNLNDETVQDQLYHCFCPNSCTYPNLIGCCQIQKVASKHEVTSCCPTCEGTDMCDCCFHCYHEQDFYTYEIVNQLPLYSAGPEISRTHSILIHACCYCPTLTVLCCCMMPRARILTSCNDHMGKEHAELLNCYNIQLEITKDKKAEMQNTTRDERKRHKQQSNDIYTKIKVAGMQQKYWSMISLNLLKCMVDTACCSFSCCQHLAFILRKPTVNQATHLETIPLSGQLIRQ